MNAFDETLNKIANPDPVKPKSAPVSPLLAVAVNKLNEQPLPEPSGQGPIVDWVKRFGR